MPAPGVRGFLPPGDWSRLTNTCDVDEPAPADVRPVPQPPGPKVLLLGDSVGCFVGAALDINQRPAGVVTLNRARLGCPLVAPSAARSIDGEPVTVYPPCIEGQQPAIAAFRPDVAVLMVGGPDISEADLGDGQWVGACTAAFDAWYEAGARSTIEALSATGAPVVVVSLVHPPEMVDIGPGITMPPVYGRDVECENRALRRAVEREPRAHYLDLDAYVCPDGKCRDEIDGVALRTDGRHFQGPPPTSSRRGSCRGVLRQAGLQPFSWEGSFLAQRHRGMRTCCRTRGNERDHVDEHERRGHGRGERGDRDLGNDLDPEAVRHRAPHEPPHDQPDRDPQGEAHHAERRRLPRHGGRNLAAAETDRLVERELATAPAHRRDERVADRDEREEREQGRQDHRERVDLAHAPISTGAAPGVLLTFRTRCADVRSWRIVASSAPDPYVTSR